MTQAEPTLPAPMPPSTIDFASVFAAQTKQAAREAEGAIAAGVYDLGLETLRAESFRITDARVIYTHPGSGAETQLLTITQKIRNAPLSLADALDWLTGPTSGPGAAGKFTDSATGEHGDLLDIIRERTGITRFPDLLAEARAHLGRPQPVIPEVPVPHPHVLQEMGRRPSKGPPLQGRGATDFRRRGRAPPLHREANQPPPVLLHMRSGPKEGVKGRPQ